jgi:anti-sigma-K factor RskA
VRAYQHFKRRINGQGRNSTVLGLVGSGDFTSRQVLASYDTDTIKAASYAVTIEQGGGSPDGTPHSAPVYAGKLVETVPPR